MPQIKRRGKAGSGRAVVEKVQAATLFIVGGDDRVVLDLNYSAMAHVRKIISLHEKQWPMSADRCALSRNDDRCSEGGFSAGISESKASWRGRRVFVWTPGCNFAGSVAVWTGHIVYLWRVCASPSGPCGGCAGVPTAFGAQDHLTRGLHL